MQNVCNYGDSVPVTLNPTDLYGNPINISGYVFNLVVYNATGFRTTVAMATAPSGANAGCTLNTSSLPGVGDYGIAFESVSGPSTISSTNPMNLKVLAKP